MKLLNKHLNVSKKLLLILFIILQLSMLGKHANALNIDHDRDGLLSEINRINQELDADYTNKMTHNFLSKTSLQKN